MNSSLSTLHLQLSGLPQKARNDFNLWKERLEPVLPLKKRILPELRAIAAREDLPVKTVVRKYYLVKKKGWLGLVNRALAGPQMWNTRRAFGLSPEDRELVKFYCENNQRSSHAAMKQLRRDWARKRVCESMRLKVGADGAAKIEALLRKERKVARNGYPTGWSVTNLLEHKPTKFELKAVRIGRTAAAAHRPLVYTTRKGLWVGSHYMIDDMWHDFFVNTFAEQQAGRPLELFSHDLFSARKVRWGIRVRTRKDDGSYNALTEQMTRMILAATLFLDGYSQRGTKIVAEHGTAAVREGIERALHEMSDGLITVSRSGMTGAAAHAGQYPGISRGNFRHKASLESGNNLTHNVFASLPGQTGKDVAHRPEGLGAMLTENRDLLAAREQILSASVSAVYDRRAELLQFPILEVTQFHEIAHELYAAIDNDPEHTLNDWVECGHTVNELRIGDQWIDQRQLPAAVIGSLQNAIASGDIATRPRRMTRGEVWRAGAADLVRIHGSGVCAILGDDLARPRKVGSNRFEFEDQEVGPGVHRYHAIARTPHGEELRLADGERYETFVNPFAPETLFVRRANGAYIGECRRIDAPCRADVEAVQRACGAAAKTQAELLAPIRTRHLAEGREKLRRHQTNTAVIGGKALTMADRCEALANEGRVQPINEFLGSATAADSIPQEPEAPVDFSDEGSRENQPIAPATDFL